MGSGVGDTGYGIGVHLQLSEAFSRVEFCVSIAQTFFSYRQKVRLGPPDEVPINAMA